VFPEKFTNVTNGIASRRWLIQSNPSLTVHIATTIGKDFDNNMANLEKLMKYTEDHAFLDTLAQSKFMNKSRFCNYIMRKARVMLDPASIFDTQVKRLHEYKRQHMNLLDMIATYLRLKENPNADFVPRTYIFGAKAAAGYHLAKQIIHLICTLSKMIGEDPVMREKMRVVFLEEYNVTLSELLMPASEISQQISLAGTEASGTGNMKLMLNGAITIGTLDGANVEILREVGPENILIFGMTADEAKTAKANGYHPRAFYEGNDELRQAVDFLKTGFPGESGPSLHDILLTRDEYMALADFAAYREARKRSEELYKDKYLWQKMSLVNIAKSGYFCADRAVSDYARRIWRLEK
jgi:starch phosphorylase